MLQSCMLYGRWIFPKSKIFSPEKINKGVSKASEQILLRGVIEWINISNFSSQLAIFIMINLEFWENIKSFLKKTYCDLVYALNLYVFKPNYTPKQIETMNNFEHENIRHHNLKKKRPSLDWKAATMYKLKGQSSNKQTGQDFK